MAKILDQHSSPATTSLLDLFHVPPTQVAIDSSYWHKAHLANSCTNEGPWEFIVNADPHYLQLGKNYIFMKLQIVKEDGKTVPKFDDMPNDAPSKGTDKRVGPINLIGKTLFKQVKVHLNGKLVSDSGPDYAYRAFLETELNY